MFFYVVEKITASWFLPGYDHLQSSFFLLWFLPETSFTLITCLKLVIKIPNLRAENFKHFRKAILQEYSGELF